MDYAVRCIRLSNGKWHWEVIGPFPKPAGAGGIRASCCSEPGEGVCHGFPDEPSAKTDAWRKAKELEARLLE